MVTFQFTSDIVRLMGVHVLAVYIILQCAERDGQIPITHQWILDHMPDKTSPNTVTAALRWLTSPERQIAVRVTGGWRLAQNAFQLPLEYVLPEGENRAERDFGCSQSKSSVSIIQQKSGSEDSLNRSAEEWAALKAALDDHEIIGTKRKNLIACEWVNGAYVRACVEYAKAEPANWDNPAGMAITRMLEHLPAPAMRENGHPENCRCAKCKADDFMGVRNKYTGGSYADYIEH